VRGLLKGPSQLLLRPRTQAAGTHTHPPAPPPAPHLSRAQGGCGQASPAGAAAGAAPAGAASSGMLGGAWGGGWGEMRMRGVRLGLGFERRLELG
jgi:hypothetical protein